MNTMASTQQRSMLGISFAKEHSADAAVNQRHAGEQVRFDGEIQI